MASRFLFHANYIRQFYRTANLIVTTSRFKSTNDFLNDISSEKSINYELPTLSNSPSVDAVKSLENFNPDQIIAHTNSLDFSDLGISSVLYRLLDTFHVMLDMPWWGCIVSTMLLVRLVSLPLSLDVVRQEYRLNKMYCEVNNSMHKAIESAQKGKLTEFMKAMKVIDEYTTIEVNKIKIKAIQRCSLQGVVAAFIGYSLFNISQCGLVGWGVQGPFWAPDLNSTDLLTYLTILPLFSQIVARYAPHIMLRINFVMGLFIAIYPIQAPVAVTLYFWSSGLLSWLVYTCACQPYFRPYFTNGEQLLEYYEFPEYTEDEKLRAKKVYREMYKHIKNKDPDVYKKFQQLVQTNDLKLAPIPY